MHLLLLLLVACGTPGSSSPSQQTAPTTSAPSGAVPEVPAGPREPPGPCGQPLTRALLDQSLELGTGFLLNNQRPEGNFVYAYDWQTEEVLAEDNPVRQAGATWSLSLIHHETGDPAVRAALERALAFFTTHSRAADGRRWIVYPGTDKGSTGTVALVALAHIDLLRRPAGLDEVQQAAIRLRLDEYMAFLLSARRPTGLFHRYYAHEDGTPSGPATPYADGEALLAFTKAARYLDESQWRAVAEAEAEAGYHLNVETPRASESDPKVTKGYYQWSSMAWLELIDAGWKPDVYAERLIELAVWMIDDHRTLSRTRNTGYAYEGIVPAWAVAERRQDPRSEKLACTIHQGIRKLTAWQVGSVNANAFTRKAPADLRSRGGVQNHAAESLLRVDTTQHQMHAVILTRRHFIPTAE
jgi:UDP-N-acetylmuramoyl-tripeptide--D-alanyl-D-alanine ligase